MALLSRDNDVQIKREMVLVPVSRSSETSGALRPSCLDLLFDIPGIVGLACEMIFEKPGMLRATLGMTLWQRTSDGIAAQDIASADPRVLRPIATFAQTGLTSRNLEILNVAATRLGDDPASYHLIYFMPDCTIVAQDDLCLALDDLEGCDSADIGGFEDLGRALGVAYAPRAESAHARLSQMKSIERDLRDHTDIVNQATGWTFVTQAPVVL